MERFNGDEVIKILGLKSRAEFADDGRDFDVACRIAINMIQKAQHYEDLAEQGRLIELPCPIGTERFYIQNNVCENWNDDTNSCKYWYKNKNGEYHSNGCDECVDRCAKARVRKQIFTLATMETKYDMYKFENTYTTKSEAEQALAERQKQ